MIGVGTRGPGGPEMLTLAEYPDPVPGPGEILIRDSATAVNRAEKVKVPYGIFDGLVQHHFYYLSAGQDGLPDNTLRHDAAYYAKGVGLIQYSSQLEGMSRIEMRLRACRVQ